MTPLNIHFHMCTRVQTYQTKLIGMQSRYGSIITEAVTYLRDRLSMVSQGEGTNYAAIYCACQYPVLKLLMQQEGPPRFLSMIAKTVVREERNPSTFSSKAILVYMRQTHNFPVESQNHT